MNDVHATTRTLALVAAGIGELPVHVEGCDACSAELGALRALIETLRQMPDPPPRLVDGAIEAFRISVNLERLLERLAGDAVARRRAARNPARTLEEAGLPVTTELVDLLAGAQRAPATEVARRLAARAFRA